MVRFAIGESDLPRVSMTDIVKIKPPYVHFARQYHEYIFYYILEGEMFLREGEVEYHLENNDFMLLDPTRRHVGIKSSVCRFLYVHFSHECRELAENEETEGTLILPKYHHMERADYSLQCRELAESLAARFWGHEAYDGAMAACLVQELLLTAGGDYAACLHSQSVPVHGKVREVIPELIAYLNTDYAQDIISEQISERFHYHFDYLNRQFARWTGRTIFAYLNAVRIERARTLLATGFYTVSEVAAQTGFRDVYYFSRVFKKYTGMSPSLASINATIKN